MIGRSIARCVMALSLAALAWCYIGAPEWAERLVGFWVACVADIAGPALILLVAFAWIAEANNKAMLERRLATSQDRGSLVGRWASRILLFGHVPALVVMGWTASAAILLLFGITTASYFAWTEKKRAAVEVAA